MICLQLRRRSRAPAPTDAWIGQLGVVSLCFEVQAFFEPKWSQFVQEPKLCPHHEALIQNIKTTDMSISLNLICFVLELSYLERMSPVKRTIVCCLERMSFQRAE